MINDLFPAFVVIEYHSTRAAHTMTIPTREWSASRGTSGKGGYEAWNLSDRDADDMIKDLVTDLTGVCSDEVDFDRYTIYTKASVGAIAVPRATNTLSPLTGVDGTPGWFAAVASSFNFLDEEFSPVKLVLLDSASNNDFSKREAADLSVDEQAVVTEFVSTANAWSSRNGARPDSFLSITRTLNEKLRRAYGMA